MKRRYPQKSNVLLVNITRLGDMLQATPTVAGIRAENPDVRTTVLVEKQFSEVCRSIPGIDDVVPIDLSMVVRALSREGEGVIDAFDYLTEIVGDLRARGFDYCLNMSSSAYTALLLNLVGVRRTGGWTADDEGYRKIESDWAKLFATSVFHQNRRFNSLNLVDVFRCSADVVEHPRKLLIDVPAGAKEKVTAMLGAAGFRGSGPLVAVQAGASQGKRQWDPENFVRLVRGLVDESDARVVLTGSKGEAELARRIRDGAGRGNVFVAAGETGIPDLAALLEASDLLVTGDTGPMHMAVAVGTPVVAMFLASAYGFETGPYSEGNLVLQPVIGCGPCNPNKPCSKPDCHDHIDPDLVRRLVALRLRGDVTSLPPGMVDASRVIVYRSGFDDHGFCRLDPVHAVPDDDAARYRGAYRALWLDDLGGLPGADPVPPSPSCSGPGAPPARRTLSVVREVEGLAGVVAAAEEGVRALGRLARIVRDARGSPKDLGEAADAVTAAESEIERLGYHHPALGPLTRMFAFSKENLSGSDPLSLASQTECAYGDLLRRARKFAHYCDRTGVT